MKKVTQAKKLVYLGAAVHEGQSTMGVQKTPQILRDSGLFNSLKNKFDVKIYDIGDISTKSIRQILSQAKPIQHHVKNLHILSPLLEKISTTVESSLTSYPDSIMLTIGGDHSIALGTISAMLRKHPNLKVIWVDAHPDFVDITKSDHQNYHGVPLAQLCGLSYFDNFQWMKQRLSSENLVFIGLRDIDPDEWISLKKWKIKCFTMDHVDKFGIGEVVRQAIEYLDPEGNSPFHISFDIDSVDPSVVVSTGTKARGGLTHREGCHIVRRMAQERNLVGMDLVEINDDIKQQELYREAFRGEEDLGKVSQTVGMGIDLIESMFTSYLEL